MEEGKLKIYEKNGHKKLYPKGYTTMKARGLDDGEYIEFIKKFDEVYARESNDGMWYSSQITYQGEDCWINLNESEATKYNEAGKTGDRVKMVCTHEPYSFTKDGELIEGVKSNLSFELSEGN